MFAFNTTISCATEKDLSHQATLFSQHLKPGDVCLLYGELGSGKTHFTTSVYQALGGDVRMAGSPTFTLVNIYPLKQQQVFHVDLYRIDEVVEEDGIDQSNWMYPESDISFIEWPERLKDWLPNKGYKIYLKHLENGRSLFVQAI